MKRIFWPSILFCFVILEAGAQGGSAFGPKGGLSLASQTYRGYDKDILTAGHIAFYIESLSEENKNALFAQIGYHARGSAIRTAGLVGIGGQPLPSRQINWRLNNIALYLGAKEKFDLGSKSKWYFDFALRGEYTVKAHFDPPYENYIDITNKAVFGITAGIGMEMMWSELVGGMIELHVNPDITNQIYIPAGMDPLNPNRVTRDNEIRNLTLELSIGLRLLRIVEYIE